MQYLLKKFTICGIYSLHSFQLALLVYLLALLGYLIVTQLISNRRMGYPELFG